MTYFQYNDDPSNDDDFFKYLERIKTRDEERGYKEDPIKMQILNIIFGEQLEWKQYILDEAKKQNKGVFYTLSFCIAELINIIVDKKRFYENPNRLKEFDRLLDFDIDEEANHYREDPRKIKILDTIFMGFQHDDIPLRLGEISPKEMRNTIIQEAKKNNEGILSSILNYIMRGFTNKLKEKDYHNNIDEFNSLVSIPSAVASVLGLSAKNRVKSSFKPVVLIDENILHNIYNNRQVDNASIQNRIFNLLEPELYGKEKRASLYVTEMGLRNVYLTYKTINDSSTFLERQNFNGLLRRLTLIPFMKRIVESTEQYSDLDFDTALMIESARFVEADYILTDNKARFLTSHWDANKVLNTSEFLDFISGKTITFLNVGNQHRLLDESAHKKNTLSLRDIDLIFFPPMHPEANTNPIADPAMVQIGWELLLERGMEEIKVKTGKRCPNLAKIKEIALYTEETINLINESHGLSVIYYCRNLEKQKGKNQVHSRFNAQRNITILQQGLQNALDIFFEDKHPEEDTVHNFYSYCQQLLEKDNVSSENLIYKMICKKSWDYLPEAEIFSMVQQEELSKDEILYLQAEIADMEDISIQDPNGHQLLDYATQNRHFELVKVVVDRQLAEVQQSEVTSQPEF